MDLFCVPAEDDASRSLLRQPEQFPHLPAGQHAGLINNDDLVAERRMQPLILKQPFYGHGACEPDVLQLFNRAHRRCDRQESVATLPECSSQFSQGRGLAGSCRALNVHDPVMAIQNKLNRISLLWTESSGGNERFRSAQPRKTADATIDHINHFSLTD